MEEALFLTRFGSKVTLVHRRDTFRASKIMVDRARKHPKIAFATFKAVVEVEGDAMTSALVLEDTRTGERSTMQADALFIAIGHDPNTNVFAGQLDLDAAKYIASPDGVHTNIPGIFVAGDVNDIRYKQAITAAGMGCKASLEAERYLEELDAERAAGGLEAVTI
jgi:thioredoxin reductase (NADPH)